MPDQETAHFLKGYHKRLLSLDDLADIRLADIRALLKHRVIYIRAEPQTWGSLLPYSFQGPAPTLTTYPQTHTNLKLCKLSVFGHLFNLPHWQSTISSSSSSQLLTNHLLNPIRRPKTHTKVFQSSKDLAAHY